MPYFFDRNHHAHPWDHIARELVASVDQSHRAVGENFAVDHRVARNREASLLGHDNLDKVASVPEWLRKMRSYFSTRLCCTASPSSLGAPVSSYVESDNINNRVRMTFLSDRLLHVESLNSCLFRLSKKPPSIVKDLNGFLFDLVGVGISPSPFSPGGAKAFDDHVDAVACAMMRYGGQEIKVLSKLICDALGDARPPWWACFEHEVMDLVESGDPLDLCRALGLGHLEAGAWLLCWRYSVNDIDLTKVYRPTCLESNLNGCHFPSPPECSYGIAMPLGDGLPRCREIIHPPLSGALAETLSTGQLKQLSAAPLVSNRLAFLRKEHMVQLRAEFRSVRDREWFGRHW